MMLIPRQHRIKLNVVRFSKYKISYKLTQVVHAVATSSVYFPKFICQTWPWQSRKMSTCCIVLFLEAIYVKF